MQSKLAKEVLKTISSVPGLAGLASIDFTKKNLSLPKNKLIQGIKIIENEHKYYLEIAIIILENINAKNVAQELNSAITNLMKAKKLELASFNLYIRGVQ